MLKKQTIWYPGASLSSHLVTDSAWHEVLFVGELAHLFHIHLLGIIQTHPHSSEVVQSDTRVEPLKVISNISEVC